MRVLFSTTPLDGHARPMLPLARALRDRGHVVAFATEAGWHGHITSDGFEAIAAGGPHDEAWGHLTRVLGDSLGSALESRGDEVFARLFGEGHAIRKAPELAAAGDRWRADAVVFESGDLAGPVAAAALGIPGVHHSWGPMLPLSWFEAAAPLVAPAWSGLTGTPRPLAGVFDGLYVDLAPPRFQRGRPPGESTGMRPASVEPESVPAWVAALEPPLVYVTLGTLFNDPRLLRTLVEGLEGVGSAVVTTGRDVDPDVLGRVPSNVHVERFVPQACVLPRAAASIGHGGAGSTLGALAHGVPLVLMPMGADQFHVAACAESAGTAVVLAHGEVTPATVHQALTRVLQDDSYRAAAAVLRGEVETMPAPADAAAAVEAFVDRHRPG